MKGLYKIKRSIVAILSGAMVLTSVPVYAAPVEDEVIVLDVQDTISEEEATIIDEIKSEELEDNPLIITNNGYVQYTYTQEILDSLSDDGLCVCICDADTKDQTDKFISYRRYYKSMLEYYIDEGSGTLTENIELSVEFGKSYIVRICQVSYDSEIQKVLAESESISFDDNNYTRLEKPQLISIDRKLEDDTTKCVVSFYDNNKESTIPYSNWIAAYSGPNDYFLYVMATDDNTTIDEDGYTHVTTDNFQDGEKLCVFAVPQNDEKAENAWISYPSEIMTIGKVDDQIIEGSLQPNGYYLFRTSDNNYDVKLSVEKFDGSQYKEVHSISYNLAPIGVATCNEFFGTVINRSLPGKYRIVAYTSEPGKGEWTLDSESNEVEFNVPDESHTLSKVETDCIYGGPMYNWCGKNVNCYQLSWYQVGGQDENVSYIVVQSYDDGSYITSRYTKDQLNCFQSDGVESYSVFIDDIEGLTGLIITKIPAYDNVEYWMSPDSDVIEVHDFDYSVNKYESNLKIGQTDRFRVIQDGKTVEAKWSSDDESIVVVDDTGKIKALSEGDTFVFASVPDGLIYFNVSVKGSMTPVEGNKYYSVTNIDKDFTTVVDDKGVKLPSDWSWDSSDISAYVGAGEQKVTVVNKDSTDLNRIEEDVNVYFATVTGLNVEAKEGSTVQVGKGVTLESDVIIAGSKEAYDIRCSRATVNYELAKASDAANVKIEGSTVTAHKKGTYTIKATLALGDTVLATSNIKLNVVDDSKGIADVQFDIQKKVGETFVSAYDLVSNSYVVSKSDVVQIVDNTPSNIEKSYTYKISYALTDTAVAKLGRAIDKITPLTIVKDGYITITATADDDVKSTKSAVLQVIDEAEDAITIDQNSFTINTLKDEKAIINVIDSNSAKRELYAAKLDTKVAGMTVAINPDKSISLGATEGGKAKLILTFMRKSDSSTFNREYDISVKTVAKAPAVTLKQIDAFNIFYNYYPTYSVGINEGTITSVSAVYDDKGTEKTATVLSENGILKVTNIPTSVKKLDFKVSIDGYKAPVVKKNVSVAQEKESFSAKSTKGTIYTGLESESASYYTVLNNQIIDKKTSGAIDLAGTMIDVDNENYYCKPDGNVLRLYVKKEATESNSSDKLKITISKEGWADTISFDYTVSKTLMEKAAIELGSNKLTLYSYEDIDSNEVSTKIALKGGFASKAILDKITIDEVVGRGKTGVLGKELKLKIDSETGNLIVTKGSKDLAAGTYKFNLVLEGYTKKPLTASLTVNVVNVDKEGKKAASVKVTAKGNIDALNRAASSVVLTPKFTNIPSDAVIVDVNLGGKDAYLFNELTQGRRANTSVLSLKPDVLLKSGQYIINLTYELQIGDSNKTITSPDIKIKISQKSFNTLLTGTNVINGSKRCSIATKIKTTNADKMDIGTKRIELTTPFDGAFAIDEEKSDLENNELVFNYTPGKLKKGKSYSLKLKVYPTDACTNTNPKTVTYKVTVK